MIQIAIKTSIDIFYFQTVVPFAVLLENSSAINFGQIWDGNFASDSISFESEINLEDISRKLSSKGFKVINNHSLVHIIYLSIECSICS